MVQPHSALCLSTIFLEFRAEVFGFRVFVFWFRVRGVKVQDLRLLSEILSLSRSSPISEMWLELHPATACQYRYRGLDTQNGVWGKTPCRMYMATFRAFLNATA